MCERDLVCEVADVWVVVVIKVVWQWVVSTFKSATGLGCA